MKSHILMIKNNRDKIKITYFNWRNFVKILLNKETKVLT